MAARAQPAPTHTHIGSMGTIERRARVHAESQQPLPLQLPWHHEALPATAASWAESQAALPAQQRHGQGHGAAQPLHAAHAARHGGHGMMYMSAGPPHGHAPPPSTAAPSMRGQYGSALPADGSMRGGGQSSEVEEVRRRSGALRPAQGPTLTLSSAARRSASPKHQHLPSTAPAAAAAAGSRVPLSAHSVSPEGAGVVAGAGPRPSMGMGLGGDAVLLSRIRALQADTRRLAAERDDSRHAAAVVARAQVSDVM